MTGIRPNKDTNETSEDRAHTAFDGPNISHGDKATKTAAHLANSYGGAVTTICTGYYVTLRASVGRHSNEPKPRLKDITPRSFPPLLWQPKKEKQHPKRWLPTRSWYKVSHILVELVDLYTICSLPRPLSSRMMGRTMYSTLSLRSLRFTYRPTPKAGAIM